MKPDGLFVTGHVRSGTSMVAGLFARHGVFFGRCTGPSPQNRRGFFENRWLKHALQNDEPGDWPSSWFDRLVAEGWAGGPWGAKMMPKWWPWLRDTDRLACVVLCYRPEADILASCERVGWPRSEETIADRWAMMGAIRSEADCPVYRVDADKLVKGDLRQLEEPFRALGLELSPAIAREWIDPDLWRGAA